MTEKQFIASKALEGDVRVTSPTGAAESAIAVNPVQPDHVVAGSNQSGIGSDITSDKDGNVYDPLTSIRKENGGQWRPSQSA